MPVASKGCGEDLMTNTFNHECETPLEFTNLNGIIQNVKLCLVPSAAAEMYRQLQFHLLCKGTQLPTPHDY